MIGLGVALVASVAALDWLVRHMPSQPPSAERIATDAAGSALPALWPVPRFSYRDQDDRPFTERELAGHVVIADFIFTTCRNVCPMMTSRMILLQRRLRDPALRFVSFSVDPVHDTVEALAAYRARWRLDTRWLLARTDATLPAFARGMRVVADPQSDPDNPILHSSMFFLIDAQGVVRKVYDSNDAAALDRLGRDASTLSTSAGKNPASQEQSLMAALGCSGCHDRSELAPPLGGLLGQRVDLEGGAHVVADATYLRRSVVEPGAQVVAGYVPLMPSYASALTPSELDALMREVMALPPPPSAPASAARAAAEPAPAPTPAPRASTASSSKATAKPLPSVAMATATGTTVPAAPTVSASAGAPVRAPEAAVPTTATDPVCGMKIRVTPDTPRVSRDGQTRYFCSQQCRDEYLHRTGG